MSMQVCYGENTKVSAASTVTSSLGICSASVRYTDGHAELRITTGWKGLCSISGNTICVSMGTKYESRDPFTGTTYNYYDCAVVEASYGATLSIEVLSQGGDSLQTLSDTITVPTPTVQAPTSVTIPSSMVTGKSYAASISYRGTTCGLGTAAVDSDDCTIAFEAIVVTGSAVCSGLVCPTAVGSLRIAVRAYSYEKGMYSDYVYSNTATVTVLPNTAPTTPATITVPASVSKGDSIPVTWSAATDAENNLSGYELQRSVNSGAFTTIASLGKVLTYTDTAVSGWSTVQYRVRATDSGGLTSAYRTSSTVQVIGIIKLTLPISLSASVDPNTADAPVSFNISSQSSGDVQLFFSAAAATDNPVKVAGADKFPDWNILNVTDTMRNIALGIAEGGVTTWLPTEGAGESSAILIGKEQTKQFTLATLHGYAWNRSVSLGYVLTVHAKLK